MNDDLEPRLRNALRHAPLPAAPASLVEALERVPSAPVVRRRAGGGRSVWAPLAVAAVLVVAGAAVIAGGQRGVAPGPTTAVSPEASTPESAPIAGLLRVEYQVQPILRGNPNAADMAAMVAILKERLALAGVAGPTVRSEREDRIILELEAWRDPDPVRNLVGQTGHLDFVPLGTTEKQVGDLIDPSQFPALFSGDQLQSAAIVSDQAGGRAVSFVLKPEGARLFANYTAANIGKYFAIVVDARVVSAPVVNSAIPDGQVEITAGGVGGFSVEAAQNLVAVMQSGALPFPLREVSNEIVPASASPSPATH